MSVSDLPPVSQELETPPQAAPRRATSRAVWVRLLLAFMVLVVSGGARFWQEHKVNRMLAKGRISPFPLKDIPLVLDSWKGETTVLDPQIVRGTGSTDNITRHYVDDQTGVSLDVIVLYGPTSDMFIHSPEVCYPKAGFYLMDGPTERQVPGLKQNETVPFRSLLYIKNPDGRPHIEEVYFTWWYGGRWTTNVTSPRDAQRIPAMYKIQVARSVTDRRERRDFDNPCEAFLELLVREIEKHMQRASSSS